MQELSTFIYFCGQRALVPEKVLIYMNRKSRKGKGKMWLENLQTEKDPERRLAGNQKRCRLEYRR